MPTLQLTVAGQDLRAELTASAPARDLVQQLPLTLSFRDFGGQEKVAPLPQPLSMTGVPARSGAQAGDLGYYQPDKRARPLLRGRGRVFRDRPARAAEP